MATNGVKEPVVIAWEYQFAPNAQKARNYFHATGIKYKQCDQPFVKPRPILQNLGITYRRVPVVSYGKDVYCDTRGIIETGQKLFQNKALVEAPTDAAFEAFGYRTFWLGLRLVPPDFITSDLTNDRHELFAVFSRPDFKDLRPSALAELRTQLDVVEKEFLGHDKTWIGGDKCGVADIYASWIIKWAFQTLDIAQLPGFSRSDYPRVYRWFEALPPHDEHNRGEQLSADEATKLILECDYAVPDIGIDSTDPTGLNKGDLVSVETNDDGTPGNNPQKGKLVGLDRKEIVIELENSLRVHFPRIGYIVKRQ